IEGARVTISSSAATPVDLVGEIKLILSPVDAVNADREASLRLQANPPVAPRTATTDSQGHFVFRDLDVGAYRIQAAAGGYSKQEYGQRTPGGAGVYLAAGQQMKD